MVKYYLSLLGVVLSPLLFAQNEDDALRYSMTDYQGSARYEAMAGSFGALGADFSSVQSNPAGIARFTTSQFSFSFRNNSQLTRSNYAGSSASANSNAFKMGTFGFVFTNDNSRSRSGIVFNQITLGYTRLGNFHNNQRIKGTNDVSLLDQFANNGYGIDAPSGDIYIYRPFTTGLAYDVYLLDYDPNTMTYYSSLDNQNISTREVNTIRDIEKRGGMGEFNLGFAANYMNYIYFGASVNYRVVNYKEDYRHVETPVAIDETNFSRFDYTYNQETSGGGVNIKLGALFLPVDRFRIGLAFESPTFLRLTDKWGSNMTSEIWNGNGYDHLYIDQQYVPSGEYDYRIWTPMKTRASVAYIFNLRASLNLDVEHMAYSTSRLLPSINNFASDYDFGIENDEIRNQYRNVLNVRLGGEIAFGGTFFVRGGYAFLPSPYKPSITDALASQIFSFGIGKKWKNSQLDIAYKHKTFGEEYYMVNPDLGNVRTDFNTLSNSIILSYTLVF